MVDLRVEQPQIIPKVIDLCYLISDNNSNLLSTSLIGKALAFGSSEYRFDPCVLNLHNTHKPAYLQNHIHFALNQQNPSSKIIYSKQTIKLVRMLQNIGCIHRFLITKNTNLSLQTNLIHLTVFFYKNTPFFKSFRLISTPSKQYRTTLSALRLLSKTLGSSTLILSTSKGLLTHESAIQRGTGGTLLFILS